MPAHVISNQPDEIVFETGLHPSSDAAAFSSPVASNDGGGSAIVPSPLCVAKLFAVSDRNEEIKEEIENPKEALEPTPLAFAAVQKGDTVLVFPGVLPVGFKLANAADAARVMWTGTAVGAATGGAAAILLVAAAHGMECAPRAFSLSGLDCIELLAPPSKINGASVVPFPPAVAPAAHSTPFVGFGGLAFGTSAPPFPVPAAAAFPAAAPVFNFSVPPGGFTFSTTAPTTTTTFKFAAAAAKLVEDGKKATAAAAAVPRVWLVCPAQPAAVVKVQAFARGAALRSQRWAASGLSVLFNGDRVLVPLPDASHAGAAPRLRLRACHVTCIDPKRLRVNAVVAQVPSAASSAAAAITLTLRFSNVAAVSQVTKDGHPVPPAVPEAPAFGSRSALTTLSTAGKFQVTTENQQLSGQFSSALGYQSLTAMPSFGGLSVEELRLRDMQLTAPAPALGSLGLFSGAAAKAAKQPGGRRQLKGKISPKGGSAVTAAANAVHASVAAEAAAAAPVVRDGGACTFLVVPKPAAAAVARAAVAVQSAVRRVAVESVALPRQQQVRRAGWLQRRAAALQALQGARAAKVAHSVARLFAGLPAAAPPASPSTYRLHKPNQEAFCKLSLALANTVGLAPVKRWIARFLDDALRFHAAGKPMPASRHLLLSGKLGTGRRTACALIAQAFHAAGVFQSSSLFDGEGAAAAGCVVLLDKVKSDPEEVKKLNKLVEKVNAQSLSMGVPAFLVLACRDAQTLTSVSGQMTTLQKREPYKLALQPHSSLELAQIALQKVADKMALGRGVTVPLVQAAIEHRWCEQERCTRNVYVAFDMADYLAQELMLKATAAGRVNIALVAAQTKLGLQPNHLELGQQPVALEAIDSDAHGGGAAFIDVSNLGLPASVVAKHAAAAGRTTAAHTVEDKKLAAELAERAKLETAQRLARRAAVDAEVDVLIGMSGVKKWFDDMRGKVNFVESGGAESILNNTCLNMVLTGNCIQSLS
jgi:hypothetical protein